MGWQGVLEVCVPNSLRGASWEAARENGSMRCVGLAASSARAVPTKHTGENSLGGKLKREFDKLC